MSTEQVTTKAKETLKSVKELIEKAESTAQKAMARAAPAVQKSLDASVEAATKGFNSTMKTINTRTEKEQRELLGAYKRFLTSQVELVESRLMSLEERGSSKK